MGFGPIPGIMRVAGADARADACASADALLFNFCVDFFL